MTFSFYNPAVIPFEIKDDEKDKYLVFVNYPKEGRKEVAGFNARTIIQEIYNRYPPGSFDFINIFSDLPWYNKNGKAEHETVQNRIKDAGYSLSTSAYIYGDTGGRLLGINFMNNLEILSNSITYSESEEEAACLIGHTLTHETTHQWAAYIGDNETKGTDMPLTSDDGTGVHYSYGLNIGYDPVGGGRWQDNKDGTFTLLGPEEWCTPPKEGWENLRLGFPRMSDITLYLAGAIKKEEVGPMTWIDFNPADVPDLWEGYTFRPKTVKTITIEDIVKKYGEVRCVKEEVLPRTMYGNEH